MQLFVFPQTFIIVHKFACSTLQNGKSAWNIVRNRRIEEMVKPKVSICGLNLCASVCLPSFFVFMLFLTYPTRAEGVSLQVNSNHSVFSMTVLYDQLACIESKGERVELKPSK